MALTSLGDLAQSLLLRHQITANKATQQRLATELATGLAADTALHLRGDIGVLAALDADLARLGAHAAGTAEAALLAGAMQDSVERIGTLGGELAVNLIRAATIGTVAEVNEAGRDATQRLSAAVGALNATVAGRSLFAGTGTGGPALADLPAILAALDTAVAGAATAAEAAEAVTGWFADPAGFRATAYLGGPPLAPLAIGPGDAVTLDPTAADPGVLGIIAGLAMAAMLDRPSLTLDAAGRKALADAARQQLMQGDGARIDLAARIGLAQERIGASAIRNGAERAGLEIARVGMLGAEPYEAATRMEAARVQLDTLYALTARLSRLTLVDYLR